ncbi:MAG: alpha-glucosidase [Fusobacteriaceae bacterium]|nr:alpha-glucosidase [Fusobacteriaceae bacterium]MBN2838413.1 alpha-glucosidase [Fusobacteriaceae bacterium]
MEKWWKEAVGYQIYPRSFKDSNNDGIGDLRGVIEKLDYLKDLGINLIWICPMYKSPNDDNGYDISDYQDIMPDFGNMNDFDELLKETHKRNMKLIIDLVINHTSDEHKWFVESRSSKDNPKRDWYIWREGKNGEEPNNWESIFKGSAWEYDEKTKEFFLHLFTKRQPDLNWENEEVRKELYKMINWWLDKGVDGFRVDAISHIKKVEGLPDMPNPKKLKYVSSFDNHMNVNGIHKFLDELKRETFDKHQVVTVGEANGVTAEEASLWASETEGKFNMLFQFEHLELWDYENDIGFNAKAYKKVLAKWQYALEKDGWNALFVENHDIPRVVSRWGNDKEYREQSAKAFALVYFMQKGTPFIYQGQEIGMTNVKYDSIEKYNDVKGINIYKEKVSHGMSEEKAMEYVYAISRDNARSPMQWDSSDYGGFSTESSWMEINKNYKEINVKKELNDENSILNFYKNLIEIRKNSKTLIYGEFKLLLEEHDEIFAYERNLNNEKYLIIGNLSNNQVNFNMKKLGYKDFEIIVKNYEEVEEDKLKPWECRMYKITKKV